MPCRNNAINTQTETETIDTVVYSLGKVCIVNIFKIIVGVGGKRWSVECV